MKPIVKICVGVMVALCMGQAFAVDDKESSTDWPNLAAYRDKNAALQAPAADEARVVFMGDSITEFWTPAFFDDKRYVNRGISGQTTPQMLLRFRADVIDLKPRVVVILAGTNDIAGNTGPASIGMIEGNIESMAELARAHGIKVVLCSLVPANRYSWAPAIKPAEKIVALNKLLKEFAARSDLVYVDYYAPMVDAQFGLKPEYSEDGVHPNEAGYKVMMPLVENAIQLALKSR